MVLVIITASIIAVALASIGIRWALAQPKFKPLPGHPGVVYVAQGHETDPEKLRVAFELAVTALATYAFPEAHGNGPHVVALAWSLLRDVRIFVMPENEWTDDWGRRVAGLQNERNIVIGRDYAALCHELAHRLEVLMFGPAPVSDVDHEHWAKRGFNAAVEFYAQKRSTP